MSELNTHPSNPVTPPAFDAQESHLVNDERVGSFSTPKRLILLGLACLMVGFGLLTYFSNYGVTHSKDKTSGTKIFQVTGVEPQALNAGQPISPDPINEKPLINPSAPSISFSGYLEEHPQFKTLQTQYADLQTQINTQQAQDTLALKSLQDQFKRLDQRVTEQNVLIHTLTTKNDTGPRFKSRPNVTSRLHPSTKRWPVTLPFKFLALDYWGDARLAQVAFKGQTRQLNEGEQLAGWRFTGIDAAGQGAYFENAHQLRILLLLP